MAKKVFINAELDWAEEQLASWRAYVDKHPFENLKDRIEYKSTARGGAMPMVVASIEAQGKFIQETMKNYLALLEQVNKMREDTGPAKEARGSQNVPHRML